MTSRRFKRFFNAKQSGDRLRIALLIASRLNAIVEVERMPRTSASHVHMDTAQSCDVDAIEERLIVGGDRADGKSKFLAEVERLQQTIRSTQQDREAGARGANRRAGCGQHGGD